MAKFVPMKGLAEYELRLSKLSKNMKSVIAGRAIYGGADIVANKIRENISSLPAITDKQNIAAYRSGEKSKLTAKQKEGLLNSLGISKMQEDSGYLNVKVGFDGYNSVKTKKYPKGQPNQLIARVVESGSIYMDRIPFVRPAINQTKKLAEAEMARIMDNEIEKIMK